MQIAPPDHIGGCVIKAVFLENFPRELGLTLGFLALCRSDRRKPGKSPTIPTPAEKPDLIKVEAAFHQCFVMMEPGVAAHLCLGKHFAATSTDGRADNRLDCSNGAVSAVEREIGVPHAQTIGLGRLLERFFGKRSRIGLNVASAIEHRELIRSTHHQIAIGDQAGYAQRPHRLNDLRHIRHFGVADHEGLVDRRLGHQPHAHLGHNPEVGLREKPINIGAVTPFERLPRGRAFDAAHPRPQQAAIGQDHLHTALEHEMLAVRCVTYTAVKRIADWPGNGSNGGHIDPVRQVILFQIILEYLVGHARFHQRGAKLGINFEDPVHPLEIKHHLPWRRGRCHAVTHVFSGRDGPERLLVLVGNPHQFLHFFYRCRGDCADRHIAVGRIRNVGFAVGNHGICIGEHPFIANNAAHFSDRAFEIGLADRRREWGRVFLAGDECDGGPDNSSPQQRAAVDVHAHLPFSAGSALLADIHLASASSSEFVISVGRKAGIPFWP